MPGTPLARMTLRPRGRAVGRGGGPDASPYQRGGL